MKRILTALFTALMLTFSAFAVDAPQVQAPSALLIEASGGTVLYEKNCHERMAPASITKVMTMLLTVEAVENGKITLDDTVTASDHASSMGGSQIYLEPGEQMSMHEMLKSIAVASANDACVAVAEHIAGSEDAFVSLMNERARQLGMDDTHFDNCCGLDSETHYTSAYDIALMSRELLKHDIIRPYITIWMDTIRGGEFGLTNTNKLIRFYDGATGVKTGFTSGAMYCVSASAIRSGMELIAVVMHSDSSPHRNADASGLLNYGFANYALVGFEDEIPMVPVECGKEEFVKAVPEHEAKVLVDKGEASKVEKTVTLTENVTAPVEKGQKLGEICFSIDGRELEKITVVAAETVERLSLGEIWGNVLGKLFAGE